MRGRAAAQNHLRTLNPLRLVGGRLDSGRHDGITGFLKSVSHLRKARLERRGPMASSQASISLESKNSAELPQKYNS